MGEGGPRYVVVDEVSLIKSIMENKLMIPYNPNLVDNAKTLRKNMTPEEKHLWYDFLKMLPLSVRRQHNIENYIVDFYIASKKMSLRLMGCNI